MTLRQKNVDSLIATPKTRPSKE